MPTNKNEQISLSQYQELKAKKGKHKKLLDLPLPVKLIFTVPLIFFIILILGYVFYVRNIGGQG
jgi:hypothetical protein